MAFSYSALVNLLAEDGRADLLDQIDNSVTIVDWKQMGSAKKNPGKVFSKMLRPEEVGRVQIDNSSMDNIHFQQDGGTRTAATQLTYASGTYGFSIIAGDLEFPQGITQVARGGNGIDLYDSAIAKSAAQFARQSERALINHELAATENSETLGANVTVEVDDVSGFRPGGMLVDIYASDGTTLKQAGAVTGAVTSDGDGTGSVVITSLTSNLVAGDRLFIAGSGGAAALASSLRCVNIRDIVNSSIALYSGLNAADQPAGTLDSTTTAWSNAAGKRMNQRILADSGTAPDAILVHPFQAQKIYESQNPNLRFSTGDTIDMYGPTMKFDGCQVFVSNNAKPKSAMHLNTKEHITKLHVFWDPAPAGDGGKNVGWSRDALQLSQINFSWKLFLSLGMNLRVTRRNAHGLFTNLNAAF